MTIRTFRYIGDEFGSEVRLTVRREDNWGGLPVATLLVENCCSFTQDERPTGSPMHQWLLRGQKESGLRFKFRAVGWTLDRGRWTRPLVIDPKCAAAVEVLLGPRLAAS